MIQSLFTKKNHKRHSTTRLWWWGMECPLWVWEFIVSSIFCTGHCHAICNIVSIKSYYKDGQLDIYFTKEFHKDRQGHKQVATGAMIYHHAICIEPAAANLNMIAIYQWNLKGLLWCQMAPMKHDDVLTWTQFDISKVLCAGIPPVTCGFRKGPVVRNSDDFFVDDLNIILNKQLISQWKIWLNCYVMSQWWS